MTLPCLRTWTRVLVGPQQGSYKPEVSKSRKRARFLQDWISWGPGTQLTDGAASHGKAVYLVPPSLLLPPPFLPPFLSFLSQAPVKTGGGLAGVSSRLPPYGVWGLNSDLQAWWVPLYTEHLSSPCTISWSLFFTPKRLKDTPSYLIPMLSKMWCEWVNPNTFCLSTAPGYLLSFTPGF